MNASEEVLFDTWAWWEVLHETPKGRQLWKRYGGHLPIRIRTSVLTLAELLAKLVEVGYPRPPEEALAFVETRTRVEPVSEEQARKAGPLRRELRLKSPKAGLVDALILAAAQGAGLALISGDRAYVGRADVRAR